MYNKQEVIAMQEIISIENMEILESQRLEASMMEDFAGFIDASENTVKTYLRGIRQMFAYLYLKGIDRPTREDIIAFREELKTGHKATTVQNYMIAVKMFFKWSSSRGLYPNIAENLKGAKITREHKKDYLTSKQVKRVLASIDTTTVQGKRDYAIVALMVGTALRDKEVVNANIEDMRTIGDNTVLFVLGKGREEKAEYVKIMGPVEDAIMDYMEQVPPEIRKPGSPLFVSLSNNSLGSRLTERSVSRICKNALKGAGYDSDRLTAHSLRHTAVTLSLIGGMSLQEAQQFARHANMATTQIYAHNLDRAKNKCEETIAKAIF